MSEQWPELEACIRCGSSSIEKGLNEFNNPVITCGACGAEIYWMTGIGWMRSQKPTKVKPDLIENTEDGLTFEVQAGGRWRVELLGSYKNDKSRGFNSLKVFLDGRAIDTKQQGWGNPIVIDCICDLAGARLLELYP